MKIEVWTDGASTVQHPEQPGGWAWAYVTSEGNTIQKSGGKLGTTNNQMEMWAVIDAINSLPEVYDEAVIYSDSQYVVKGWNEWMPGWVRRGWRTATGDPVKNQDLWSAMTDAYKAARMRGTHITIDWVKGHADDPMNNLVDKLAVFAKNSQ